MTTGRPAAGAADTSGNTNPYVKKTDNGTTITSDGKAYLEQAVTDATGQVYAFSDKLSPVTIAAAMARLSRRGDDMRITILDEFAHALSKDGDNTDAAAGKDAQLLHRVITAYGDDSVQQLVVIPLVVEDASQLLTKKLQWGRLASYLEQSTRYIYYDQRDSSGQYRYVVPEQLDKATKHEYTRALDDLFDRYSSIVRQVTQYVSDRSTVPQEERDGAWKGAIRAQACDAARAVLPTATKTTVGIFASGQAIESLVMHLLSDELPEAKRVGQQILEQARKVIPAFLERADKPDRGGAVVAYRANTANAVRQLAQHSLPSTTANTASAADTDEPVTLTSVWPRNELDLVADMLYEHSNLPLNELRKITESWSYDQKAEVFATYFGERLNRRHKPGRAIEKAHYSWDLICDYGIFRDLQRHRMVDDLEWQTLSPDLGFETPALIEEAGLAEEFEQCFTLSSRLYNMLHKRGYALEAQYATLLGHRMRWKVTYNAREAFHLHELRTSPQGHPGYRKLVLQMHAKLAEVHPLMAAAMKFVNQGEDPELTRLAAERYTQFKLQQLDQ
jgi:thymidylate synthase ThyX